MNSFDNLMSFSTSLVRGFLLSELLVMKQVSRIDLFTQVWIRWFLILTKHSIYAIYEHLWIKWNVLSLRQKSPRNHQKKKERKFMGNLMKSVYAVYSFDHFFLLFFFFSFPFFFFILFFLSSIPCRYRVRFIKPPNETN